ncbi:MAG: aminopeptidase P family protein [Chloroflexi bacterium]|nr:aminopeptidase P family protein [Chloroflexota bacterium]
MRDNLHKRLAALREHILEADIDALVITNPTNRRYISGFTGSAGILLVNATCAFLATDFRYYEQAPSQAPAFSLKKGGNEIAKLLPQMLDDMHASRVGFESVHLSYADYQTYIQAAPQVEWVPTTGLVEDLRVSKDGAELDLIRQAVALTDTAFTEVTPQFKQGMTEREAAWLLESFMRVHGAEQMAFDIIVAGGPNGAMPHAHPSDAPLLRGQPIVIDMGARVQGYDADMTRTICLGPTDNTFREIYAIVLRAQQAATAALRPQMSGKEVDTIARQIITEAGYGDYFGHSLGHGAGLDIHERPRLSQSSSEILKPGNTVTIEPGIYLPGWGGIRIEDFAVITETGCEVLTKASKEASIPGT